MSILQVSEMVNIAIKDEETGEAFYKALAENCKKESLRQKLMMIAEQEKKHRARFADMLGNLKNVKTHQEYDGQYESYLATLCKSRAFMSPDEAVKKAKAMDIEKGIEAAMHMERDTILFYEELIKFIPDQNSKYIKEIIQEEKNHLADFAGLKN